MSETVHVVIRTKRSEEHHDLRKGLGFQALAAQTKTPLEFDCRKADCGICIMRVDQGADALSPQTDSERDFLKAMRALPEERLACQCRILGDVSIFVEDP